MSQMIGWGLAAVLLLVAPVRAALFLGPSFFSTTPNSQMGAVTNGLILTDNATGFVVSGQVTVAVPPVPALGTLVS